MSRKRLHARVSADVVADSKQPDQVHDERRGRVDSAFLVCEFRDHSHCCCQGTRDSLDCVDDQKPSCHLVPPTSQEGTRTRDWMDPLLSVNLPKMG